MLKRLYANGFRCFVDFEYRPGRLDLLGGRPGSGRSSIRRVLDNLENFLLPWSDEPALCDSFWSESYTRWLPGRVQTFELEIEHQEHHFFYRVEAHFTDDEYRPILTAEQLGCDGQLLFSFSQDPERPHIDVRYHPDDDDAPAPSPQALVGNRHYLCHELADTADARLQIFRDWWQSAVWSLQAGPEDMRELDGEATRPGTGFSAFTPWYRYMLRTAQDRVIALDRELAEVIDGYIRLRPPRRDNRHVDVLFRNPMSGDPIAINFDDLAVEQRILIELYAIIHLGLDPGRVLILDAPNAAISRVDMRRWLSTLVRTGRDVPMQILVMVNEPEILEDLPGATVRRFERPEGGATRVV